MLAVVICSVAGWGRRSFARCVSAERIICESRRVVLVRPETPRIYLGQQRSWEARNTALRSLLDCPSVGLLLGFAEDLDRIDLTTATPPLVMEADEETVSFTFRVKARVIFVADFTFYAGQSSGEEAVEVAAVRRDVEKTIDYEVLLTVARDEGALHAIRHAFVDRPVVRISFGTVDPFAR